LISRGEIAVATMGLAQFAHGIYQTAAGRDSGRAPASGLF
jgi:hypothetical protein